MIIAGASAYPRILHFDKFEEIAKRVGAYLMVDMAHIAGLVAAGCHPNPVPHAEFVTTTTHKTLRGPRGGFILCRHELAKAIDSAVFPGIQIGRVFRLLGPCRKAGIDRWSFIDRIDPGPVRSAECHPAMFGIFPAGPAGERKRKLSTRH